MRFHLWIDLDNAAFNPDGERNIGPECARILRILADRMEYVTSGVRLELRDNNGNRVGKAETLE